MEKEKLEQAKKTFAEDSDKYHKYKKDLRDTTKDVKDEYDRAVNEKNGRMTEIKRLEQEIISDDLKIKKIDDYL
jgi:predicted phage-related endonuclease